MSETPEVAAAPKPLDVDGVNAMVVGTIAWLVALCALAVFMRGTLAAHDATWWIWVCAAGVVIGLIGLQYVWRRRTLYRHAKQVGS